MKNTVLQLLQILENETDAENMLTKAQILQMMADNGYSMEEKQFYRKIEELRDNGYNVEIRKGKHTYYFLQKDRLRKEEWLFLLALLCGSQDISQRETNHILSCLESANVSQKMADYAQPYKEKFISKKSNVKVI